jgi:hypothetical protein
VIRGNVHELGAGPVDLDDFRSRRADRHGSEAGRAPDEPVAARSSLYRILVLRASSLEVLEPEWRSPPLGVYLPTSCPTVSDPSSWRTVTRLAADADAAHRRVVCGDRSTTPCSYRGSGHAESFPISTVVHSTMCCVLLVRRRPALTVPPTTGTYIVRRAVTTFVPALLAVFAGLATLAAVSTASPQSIASPSARPLERRSRPPISPAPIPSSSGIGF